MRMINTRTTTTNFHEKNDHFFKTIIPTLIPTSTPTWKLYENPSYTCPPNHQQNKQQEQHQNQNQDQENKQLHLLHLPVSGSKIAASFWDLTFIKPFMDSDFETAQAHIMELKAQLEYERKARKKAVSLTKKLMKQVLEERKETQTLEKVREELSVELASHKSEISRLKTDMEEERKMLRVAEVLREERVHMKLSDAKILLEEKISELKSIKMTQKIFDQEKQEPENVNNVISRDNSVNLHGRKVSLDAENPHIKRGIRGFVEFPRVVKAIGSRSRHLGTKLECQKAQLMILLKQKTQIQSNNLIIS
ncbi:protein BRANCHLESS TRICHOME-like [Rutidosis leptorrhynchoides]|uniref:protein BRANCHLESS TRICHOME-like n=1 Tax=Rutidosis leptorrhynchoides TaxID=125765 RepID=UPI003A9A1310